MRIVNHSRYLLEHGLKSDGRIDQERIDEVSEGGSYETFFTETSSGKYVPRSIFVDLDPSVRASTQGYCKRIGIFRLTGVIYI